MYHMIMEIEIHYQGGVNRLLQVFFDTGQTQTLSYNSQWRNRTYDLQHHLPPSSKIQNVDETQQKEKES